MPQVDSLQKWSLRDPTWWSSRIAHPHKPLIQSKTDNVKIFCKQEITVIFPETAIEIYQDLDVTKVDLSFGRVFVRKYS